MFKTTEFPGTKQHQNILKAITTHYENDPRILAILVFGSLSRGNWDRYSDLDLDVVVANGITLDTETELRQLGNSLEMINEQIALLIPGNEDADIVFKSLMELSIRYHPLNSTHPNIIDSMRLLMGRIDLNAIEAAGLANRVVDDEPLSRELDRCIRLALEVDSALHRGYLWSAIELLHYMRQSIMELFTYSHGGKRPYQFFQKEADQKMQSRLGGTLPVYNLSSAKQCLSQFLDILTKDLDVLTDSKVHLSDTKRELLIAICSRMNDLK